MKTLMHQYIAYKNGSRSVTIAYQKYRHNNNSEIKLIVQISILEMNLIFKNYKLDVLVLIKNS